MSDYITRERNLTLLTDYYEYTMVNGYFHAGIQDKIAVFDVFFRRVPENGGFAIYAGLQQIIELINGLSFTEEDIEYFRKKGCFSEKFFNFLRNFKFRCDVWSIKEGTPIFPNEPIITVRGPLEQVQMVETMLLVTFNFETLIATKAPRPGVRWRYARCPCRLHRGLCRYRLYHQRPHDGRSGFRHYGPQLGSGLRERVRGL